MLNLNLMSMDEKMSLERYANCPKGHMIELSRLVRQMLKGASCQIIITIETSIEDLYF
jgi:hypothetical protein